MSAPRVLIAGLGNIFLGDDAFGVEVVQRLQQQPLPPEVRVVDFGIRGIDLTYALMDGYETVVLVDAAPRGEPPGTLYLLEPERPAVESGPPPDLMLDMHGMEPAKVLSVATALGMPVQRVLLLGCQPLQAADAEEFPQGLSPPVQAAVAEAVRMLQSLIPELLASTPDRVT